MEPLPLAVMKDCKIYMGGGGGGGAGGGGAFARHSSPFGPINHLDLQSRGTEDLLLPVF